MYVIPNSIEGYLDVREMSRNARHEELLSVTCSRNLSFKDCELIMKNIKTMVLSFLLLSIMTGLLYPLFITLIASICFPWQAQGSLLTHQGQTVGSALIGQSFTQDQYFWSRPSATPGYPYNSTASAGSNLAPTNPVLLARIQASVQAFMKKPHDKRAIPADLVTASGSGLDPDLSPNAVLYQIPRIAAARHLSEKNLILFVKQHVQPRFLGFLGEPHVNVLALNLALDQWERDHAKSTN